jgi:hypothetical protein
MTRAAGTIDICAEWLTAIVELALAHGNHHPPEPLVNPLDID